jgi:hypothetical protein
VTKFSVAVRETSGAEFLLGGGSVKFAQRFEQAFAITNLFAGFWHGPMWRWLGILRNGIDVGTIFDLKES